MQVRTTQLGVAVYLAPDSAIVEEGVDDLSRAVHEGVGHGMTNVVLDMKNVPVVDSAGLEFLLDLSQRLREEGGSLRIANVRPICKDIFAITEVDQVVPVYEDLDGAGRSFL